MPEDPKKSVEDLLPDGITKRPKEGFILPVFDWMVEELKDYSVDVLSGRRLMSHGLLNKDTVNGIIKKTMKETGFMLVRSVIL